MIEIVAFSFLMGLQIYQAHKLKKQTIEIEQLKKENFTRDYKIHASQQDITMIKDELRARKHR